MSIVNILPIVENLPHADKFQLMQFLLRQLASEEGISLQEEQSKTSNQGEKMAFILQQMADRGALSEIADPVAWQQEVRQDPPLPGRK